MNSKPPIALEFTGERFTPECVREIWYEHVHRYVLAGDLVGGLNVLDAACGEGYGSYYLSGKAAQVTGVDISPNSIAHAQSRYPSENLQFRQADCSKLPFADGQFDCIVSFETIEHLQEQEEMLAEFRRVLKSDGFLLISSPDKAVYSGRLKNQNPFHVRELERHQFEAQLAAEFPASRLLGHRLAFHSMIWTLDQPLVQQSVQSGNAMEHTFHRHCEKETSKGNQPAGEAVYLVALCAAEPQFLPDIGAGVWWFDDESESVYEHYQHEIRKNMHAGQILQDRQNEINALNSELQQLRTQVKAEESRTSWWRRLFK